MASKDWKGYTWTSDHGYTFGQMWNFLEYGNVLDTRVEFSNELMIGLFWEESIFQNWWQKGGQGQEVIGDNYYSRPATTISPGL